MDLMLPSCLSTTHSAIILSGCCIAYVHTKGIIGLYRNWRGGRQSGHFLTFSTTRVYGCDRVSPPKIPSDVTSRSSFQNTPPRVAWNVVPCLFHLLRGWVWHSWVLVRGIQALGGGCGGRGGAPAWSGTLPWMERGVWGISWFCGSQSGWIEGIISHPEGDGSAAPDKIIENNSKEQST